MARIRDPEKFEEKQKQILDTSVKMFASKGFDGVSVRDICKELVMPLSSLYNYYGSKERIYREIWIYHISILFDRLDEKTLYAPNTSEYDKDVFPVLKEIVMIYFSFAEEYKTFYSLLLSHTYAPISSEAASIAAAYYDKQYFFLENLFVHMADAHGNLYMKEKYLAVSFLAVINSWIGLWILNKATLSASDAGIIVKQFMHGIFS